MKPIQLSVSSDEKKETKFLDSNNYYTILVLAWCYVLSARWVEIMSVPCSIVYSERGAHGDYLDGNNDMNEEHSIFSLDIPGACPREARWWSAVLAQGQGWTVTVSNSDALLSPWSACLSLPQCRFSVSITGHSKFNYSAPSFSAANAYLQRFCKQHNIFHQSKAALAAALLLPSFGHQQTLQLNMCRGQFQRMETECPQERVECHNSLHLSDYLDKCIALGCNTKGIRPILLSIFYKPNIHCNEVTPWLQGSLAAIDAFTIEQSEALLQMVTSQPPITSWLWFGVTVLGLQKSLLQQVRYGQLPIDLVSCSWAGTIQSFMQAPLGDSGHKSTVARADECRLLFLTQSAHHLRLPVCQWKPFGSTPIESADIEIRKHAACQGHGLQYEGFSWDCSDGPVYYPPSRTSIHSYSLPLNSAIKLSPSTHVVNRESEVVSENATRSIFGWLRFDGYTDTEKEIWQHAWFTVTDSDDEVAEEEDEADYSDLDRSQSGIRSWLAQLPGNGEAEVG